MAGEYVSYNEPVAWMSTTGNNFVSKKAPSYVKAGTNDWIPLYTHPEKTLTNSILDEIHAKLFRVLDNWKVSNLVDAEDGEPFPLADLLSEEGGTIESGKHEIECIVDELVYEIEAILRKAQEK